MKQLQLFRQLLIFSLMVSTLGGCDSSRSGSATKSQDTASDSAKANDMFRAGDPAVPFAYPDVSGKNISLKDFSGKVVLLNFWATWCVPCVKEMPALERLHQALKSEGFVVLAINSDPPDNRAEVEKFIKENGLSFPVLFDPEVELPLKYGLTGFPETFFISRTGNFLAYADPETSKTEVRIISERAWDSPASVAAVRSLLKE